MSDWDQFPQSSEGPWEKLSRVAVPGAAYDSPERQPHPKCLEGTRKDLLKYIYKSLDNQKESRLIWLHGTAGVGKSAVAFTVAEKMRTQKVTEETKIETRLAGTFFFSRKHTKCSTSGHFFATLAYQLVTNFSSVRKDVSKAIRDKPAVLDSRTSLCDQMEVLFRQPLLHLEYRLRKCLPPVFVIDALDECKSETVADLISLLGKILRDPDLPVIHILLTSRTEKHIRKAIQEQEMRPLVDEIPVKTSGEDITGTISLDGADVDNDINIFLRYSFTELQSCHPDFPQPTEEELTLLASRAGRRFIVASTMMKFLDDGYNDSRGRFKLLLKLTSELLPATEVYELYDRIISTCADPVRAHLHLSVVAALADPLPISQISKLLGPGQGRDVETTLVQLRSVMDIPIDSSLPVNISHSSVRDYVSDPSNCKLLESESIISPHSLLAHGSFSLMIQDIPESTDLLNALLALKECNQAMQSDDLQRLQQSLAFVVEPPEPMRTLMGLLWLRGVRGSGLRSWLETLDGHAWLQTQDGEGYLRTQEGEDWLKTRAGGHWLKTHAGDIWLQAESGQSWLQSWPGWLWTQKQREVTGDPNDPTLLETWNLRDWLETNIGQGWLETPGGREWLLTQTGGEWLLTQTGREWLQSRRGEEWLGTSIGHMWLQQTLTGWEWLQTQGGREWLQTQNSQKWLVVKSGRQWLDTKSGQLWLDTESGKVWLDTEGGKAWLDTESGKAWLDTASGQEWLGTKNGRVWLDTARGKVWLNTARGKVWLGTASGQEWLGTENGQVWLDTARGKVWLGTASGQEWLSTKNGQVWLDTVSGKVWLGTASGKVWLDTASTGSNWLNTERGTEWLNTKGGQDWLDNKGQVWLSTVGGRAWLDTKRGQDWLDSNNGQVWLDTERGRAWLDTESGQEWLFIKGGDTERERKWLDAERGQVWLHTRKGREWMDTARGRICLQGWWETPRGREWLHSRSEHDWLQILNGLQTPFGHAWLHTWYGREWLLTRNGREWLPTQRGEEWLLTPGGREWLHTPGGNEWLQSKGSREWLQTQSGREWLQTSHGQAWQLTPAASVWVTMEDFSNTLETTSSCAYLPFLPAFQAIQEFRSLPDFLMFPAFLALRPQDHSTSAFPQDYPDIDVIHAMTTFMIFATEARERSQTTSDALKYACQNWAIHLSRAQTLWNPTLEHIFKSFWNRYLLAWLERQWCLKGLRSCLAVLSEGQKIAKEHLVEVAGSRV